MIRIATRSSQLALWQAEEVQRALAGCGITSVLVPIESTGDTHLTQPIYAMGVSGVFTRQLDIALLEGTADLAVHSLKDVPTQLATGLTLSAVLPRGAHEDVALVKDKTKLTDGSSFTIATSSLRRIAQWQAKYPDHNTTSIRGNVQTRLRKYGENTDMDGVIFAKAGLERVGLLPAEAITLDWMIPAPAQGVVGIVSRLDDQRLATTWPRINHTPTMTAAHAERQFLRRLMGGCSVPVSAYAYMSGDDLHFKGAVHSFDGTRAYFVERVFDQAQIADAGTTAAEALLVQPGAEGLMDEIRCKDWSDESTLD
ncbi:MAG: hydroxymethylbilane synthase [Bacteroidetes bacterium]|nr:hydroxymethylbilane synthase [Bacteroidota bacterium]